MPLKQTVHTVFTTIVPVMCLMTALTHCAPAGPSTGPSTAADFDGVTERRNAKTELQVTTGASYIRVVLTTPVECRDIPRGGVASKWTECARVPLAKKSLELTSPSLKEALTVETDAAGEAKFEVTKLDLTDSLDASTKAVITYEIPGAKSPADWATSDVDLATCTQVLAKRAAIVADAEAALAKKRARYSSAVKALATIEQELPKVKGPWSDAQIERFGAILDLLEHMDVSMFAKSETTRHTLAQAKVALLDPGYRKAVAAAKIKAKAEEGKVFAEKRKAAEKAEAEAAVVTKKRGAVALIVGRGVVSAKLKSPSTATVASEWYIACPDGVFVTMYTVDAQNSFGAYMRDNYAVFVDLDRRRFRDDSYDFVLAYRPGSPEGRARLCEFAGDMTEKWGVPF